MRQPIAMYAAILVVSSCSLVVAADLKDMIGKWSWQQFTIEVSECQGDSICAKVIEGPRDVGMQIFSTKLIAKGGQAKGGEWFGQIIHPETKETYNTRFQQIGSDTWRLDGCTAAKVCLTGEFARVR